MIGKFLDAFFGCWHTHYSFPISVRPTSKARARASSLTGTYVVCLDCGKELPYDWEEMRVVDPSSGTRVYGQSLATKEAA